MAEEKTPAQEKRGRQSFYLFAGLIANIALVLLNIFLFSAYTAEKPAEQGAALDSKLSDLAKQVGEISQNLGILSQRGLTQREMTNEFDRQLNERLQLIHLRITELDQLLQNFVERQKTSGN